MARTSCMHHRRCAPGTLRLAVHTIVLAMCLAVLAPGALSAAHLSVAVNGELVRTYSTAQLAALSCQVPLDGTITILNPEALEGPESSAAHPTANGVLLLDLAPAMHEAWELVVVRDSHEQMRIASDDLAEQFASLAWIISEDRAPEQTAASPSSCVCIAGEAISTPTLSVWVSWEGVPIIKEQIQRFAQAHDLSIDVLEVPKISSKLLQTQKAGGRMPDLVMVQADYVHELCLNNTIQSLDYLGDTLQNTTGNPSFFLDGHQWAVPFYLDAQMIFCNTDLFARAGLDAGDIQTLADLEHAAMVLNEQLGMQGTALAWNIYSAYWLLPFQLGFGKTDLIESDGRVVVQDEPTTGAISYLADLAKRSVVSINERDAMLSSFVGGKTAMMLSSSYMIPELERIGMPFAAIPYPINQETGLPVRPLLDYKAFAITRASRNPVLARRLIQHLCSIAVQQWLPAAIGKAPALAGLSSRAGNNGGEVSPGSALQALGDSIAIGYPLPPQVGYSIYKNVMWDMLRLMLTGKVTIDRGLAQAQQLIDVQVRDQLGIVDSVIPVTADAEATPDTMTSDSLESSDLQQSSGFLEWLRKLW